MKKSLLGQSIVEYVLLLVMVISVLIIILVRQNGVATQAIERSLNAALTGVEDCLTQDDCGPSN